jgi:hypothetical protein
MADDRWLKYWEAGTAFIFYTCLLVCLFVLLFHWSACSPARRPHRLFYGLNNAVHAAVLFLQKLIVISDYRCANNSTTHAKLTGPFKSYAESFFSYLRPSCTRISFVHLFSHFIYLPMALWPFFGPWPFFQFPDLFHSQYDSLHGGAVHRKAATCTHDSINTE